MSFQAAEPLLILASESASRRALLAASGLRFETRPARVDESEIKAASRVSGLSAVDCAMALAETKALRVGGRDPEALVIGADQILVCEGQRFDKPRDRDEARSHLLALRGRSHELVTAVVCWRDGRAIWRHVARPRLEMRHASDSFIETYLAAEGDEVTSTVGAYRLEGLGMQLFDRISGEHAAILGLPMLPLLGFLRQHGIVMS